MGAIKDNVLAVAIAGEHVVAVTQSKSGKEPAVFLTSRSKLNGKVSWQVQLDRQARLDGLAITRSGEIIVSFQDGSIELFGL